MPSRENLWQRLSGQSFWPLAWALAAACAVPWLVPEDWGGHLWPGWIAAGWLAVLASSALLRSRKFAVIPLAFALAWGTFGNLRQRALWETTLPSGLQEMEGSLAAPWTQHGTQLQSLLAISAPPALKGLALRITLPWPQDEERVVPPPPGTPVRVRAELTPVDPAPRFLVERPLWRAL